MNPLSAYLSAQQAAERLSLTVARVHQLCHAGAIAGAVFQFGRWMIPAESLAAVRKRPEKRGRPKGSKSSQKRPKRKNLEKK